MPAHFTPETLKFLRGLKRNNDRIWFNDRKDIYEQQLKEPMLAVIAAINERMLTFAPFHVRPPQKIMMRIYRDIRFSPDKRPYKTNVAAWWAREGLEKTSGGGYYFDLSSDGLMIAAGVYMPGREQLLAIRRHLLDHHAEYRRIVSTKKFKSAFTEFDGRRLTRPPKGFPADHPALDLIQCRQWGVSTRLPVEEALKPTLPKLVADHFALAAPMVDLLNTPLQPAPRKPLF